MNIKELELDSAFPHDFECKKLAEIPSGKSLYYYPNGTTTGGKDGLIVQLSPHLHDSWIGVFAFGTISPKGKIGLYSWPISNCLCVVSLGRGYLVRVDKPTSYEVISAEPILDVVPVPDRDLVIFANYTELIAYGKSGVVWKSKRISWDGIKITGVSSDHIEGEVWNPRDDATTSFRVKLIDGSHEGGIDEY